MDWLSGLISTVADFGIAGPVSYLTGLFKNLFLIIIPNTIIPLLNNVMSYQNFFSDGVNTGWEITRNFANLFFALILLIIAIATVLNISALDNYTAKRMLPNFIFVALFINFSKAIVGILIDISQIIMISFYNSFGPSMADTIGAASKIAEAASESNTEVVFLNIFTIVILAFLAFVLLWTALILAMRIVTLWFIIMFSPLAFMATLIPGLKSISDDWKKQLQEALVVGPTLMFFLYLAFAVMSNGISANTTTTGGDNLINNGNLINYVLVIGLLFLANTTATKAGQAAPPFLQKAVGVAGSIATLGIGAKVGAGGTGFRQGLKDGWSATGGKVISTGDGLIGGTTKAIQVASGGKINPNDRYEMMKQQGRERVEKGKAVENIPFIGSRIKDSRAGKWISSAAQQTLGGEAGEKANFERTQLRVAEEARTRVVGGVIGKDLDSNPALQRALAAEEAKILENYKGEEDADKVIEDIEKAVKKGDFVTARALKTHLNSLGEINKLLNQNGPFADIAEEYATEADQLAAFDKKYLKIGNSKYDRSYQVRNRNIAKSKKGMEAFGATPNTTLTPRVVNDPTTSDLFQEYKNGSISENAKKFSDNLFSSRKQDPVTGKFTFDGNGNSEYEFDILAFDDFVSGRSIGELENPDTWKSMNQSLKTEIITALRGSGLQKNDPGNTTAAAWRGIEP